MGGISPPMWVITTFILLVRLVISIHESSTDLRFLGIGGLRGLGLSGFGYRAPYLSNTSLPGMLACGDA